MGQLESWGHYAQWIKPISKVHGSIYILGNKIVVPRGYIFQDGQGGESTIIKG